MRYPNGDPVPLKPIDQSRHAAGVVAEQRPEFALAHVAPAIEVTHCLRLAGIQAQIAGSRLPIVLTGQDEFAEGLDGSCQVRAYGVHPTMLLSDLGPQIPFLPEVVTSDDHQVGLSNLTPLSVGVSTTTISGQSPPFGTNDGEAAAGTRRNRAVVDVSSKPQENAVSFAAGSTRPSPV